MTDVMDHAPIPASLAQPAAVDGAAPSGAGREIVSINGEVVPFHEARISVLDHCFLYGDGVFEGIRFQDRKVHFHAEHMGRLYASARSLRLPMLAPEEYERHLFQAIEASGMASGYVRAIVTRGVGALDINPAKCRDSKLVIIVARLQLYPAQLYETGLRIIVARTQKIPYQSFDCRIKSCNYLNNVMATWEYLDRGASEALQTDAQGFVSEATVDNVFGVRGDVLFTPGLDMNCLEGITRAKVMDLAAGMGMRVEEGRYTPSDFMAADEMFLTGTGAGVMPVTRIEHQVIGDGAMGPRTREILRRFEVLVDETATPISSLAHRP